VTGRPPRPLAIRLVEKTGAPDESGCWPWLGYRNADGYGVITVGGDDERVLRAHRVAYELLLGETIPDGLTIDHLCRNRGCVNPEHMEVVERGENVLRGEGPSARAARATHCIRGHEFTPENTYFRKSGKRECRACARARNGQSYLRHRDERLAAMRAWRERNIA
jgi:hypothetical protein